jgi:hypothetical protein
MAVGAFMKPVKMEVELRTTWRSSNRSPRKPLREFQTEIDLLRTKTAKKNPGGHNIHEEQEFLMSSLPLLRRRSQIKKVQNSSYTQS